MKVLLCDDVEKLGYLGDVVEVKQGYARNYLIPQGIAVAPTEVAIKGIAMEKVKRAGERKLVYEQLERVAETVEGAEVVVAAKVNEQGHLFGSVAEKDIAENLRDQGFEVANDMVRMDDHLKEVGEYEINIRFAADIVKVVKVVVVAQDEGQTVESDTEQSE